MATLPLPPTTEVQITRVVKALYDAAPGNLYLQAFTQYAAENGGVVGVADGLLYEHRNKTNAEVAQLIVDNLGLAQVDEALGVAGNPAKSAADNAAAFLLWQFNVADQTGATRGQVLVDALNNLATLGSDPTFGKAAEYFNASIAQAYSYSLDPANSTYDLTVLQQADEVTIGEDGTVEPPPVAGQTFTLTAVPLGDYADSAGYSIGGGTFVTNGFKFTSANDRVIATSTTAGPLDMLLDASTHDNDVYDLSVTGAANNVGTLQNIETLNASVALTSVVNPTIDVSLATGLKTINVSGTSSVANVITIDGGVAVGVQPLGDGIGVTTVDASHLTGGNASVAVSFAGASNAVTIKGSEGNDALTTSNGASTVEGGAGNDTIIGGGAADKLSGDAGHDSINGGGGADTISGGDGNDVLQGGAGADSIDGGAGNDTITGGAGNDTLTGGEGRDTFVYATGTDGYDTIKDFTAGATGDIYDTNFAPAVVGFVVNTGYATAAGAVALNTAADSVAVFTGPLQATITDFTSGAQVLAAISGTANGVTVNTDGDNVLLALVTGGNTYLYEVDESGDVDTGVVNANEITLVGILEGLDGSQLTTANFA